MSARHDRPRRPWTAEDDARLRSLAAGGMTSAEIGAEMGRTKAAVDQRWCAIKGAARRRPSTGRPRSLTDAQLAEAVALVGDGGWGAITAAAKRLGVSHQAIAYRLRRAAEFGL